MALNTTKKKAAAPKGKVATAKGKTAKATKGLAKPKEPKVSFKVGDEVEFVGYAEAQGDDALFSPGDRLAVVSKEKNDDGNVVLACVKFEDFEAFNADPDSVAGEELSTTEVKKAEKLPVDPFKFTLESDATLDAFIAEHDNDALAAGKAAVEAINQNTFLLGGALTKLYFEQKFRDYGDEGEYADDIIDDKAKSGTGWDKFCRDNFNMDGRKGEAMIRVYRSFNGLGDVLDFEEISADKGIGWVKLNAMAGVVTKDNAEELIEKARELNVNDFKSEIRENYVEDSSGSQTRDAGPRMKRVTLKIALFADQAEGAMVVIKSVANQLGVDPEKNLDMVMEHIIMVYAAENLSEADQKKVRVERKRQITELKKQGGESWKDRQQALVDLEARLTGDGEEEADEGEEAETEEAEAETEEATETETAKPRVKVKKPAAK